MKIFKPFIYCIFFLSSIIHAESRIKDIANFEGVRENQLVGYGLVVGLNGTGDNLKNSIFTQKGISEFLERLGINVNGANLKTKNIAAVMVTASLPPFARSGSKIDVRVSAIGDAKSLQNGNLLVTPLLGADGNVYAVAQGFINISEFNPVAQNVKTNDKSSKTAGIITNGAIIEKEIVFDMSKLRHIKLALRNPDFSTALMVTDVINNNIPGNIALALDAGTIQITVPSFHSQDIVNFLAQIEKLNVQTDNKAKIVIDAATGIIVIGENVKIKPVAVAQGNLMVTVQPQQNNEDGEFEFMPQAPPVDAERGGKLALLEEGATLKELVDGLNKLGVMPRDLIAILQNIKAANALNAEIEIR